MTTDAPVQLLRLITASRLTRAALVGLIALYTIVILAPFFATHDPEQLLRARDGIVLASHPPTWPQWDDGGLHYFITERSRDTTTYALTFRPIERAPLHFFKDGRLLSGEYFVPLGTDRLGRDLWARILFGGRVSLSVGLIGVTISMTIGAFLGGLAGTIGGRTDTIIMRLSEMVMMVPGLYLLLTLAAVLPKNISSSQRYILIIVVLSTIRWAGLARVIRGMVLSIRERDFVQSAVASGAGRVRLLWKYILPNTASYLIIAATLQIPGYILGESALSLLGLGIQEPEASWGNLLIDAKSGSAILLAPWLLTPGLFIVIAIVLFNVIGDALRDAWDPGSEGFLL